MDFRELLIRLKGESRKKGEKNEKLYPVMIPIGTVEREQRRKRGGPDKVFMHVEQRLRQVWLPLPQAKQARDAVRQEVERQRELELMARAVSRGVLA